MRFRRRDFAAAGSGLLASLAIGSLVRPLKSDDSPESAPRIVASWGTNGRENGQFDIPIAIAVSRSDEIAITDFRQSNAEAKGRLQRFDAEGDFLSACEIDPMPGGLAFDKDGLLYATHMMRHKVAVYDKEGKLVREFGKQGSEPGQFEQPGGIAFGPDGTLYVADQVNRRVQHFTPQGEPIHAWGKFGVAKGEFGGNVSKGSRVGGPHFLAFDSKGDLYTTEGSVGRIQKFKADGTPLLAWGDNEVGPGHFGGNKSLPGPIGIAIDSSDNIWVTSTNHRVQQFSGDGTYLRGWGGEGAEPGQLRLPHGLAFDSHGFLYVVDSRNSRILKFAV